MNELDNLAASYKAKADMERNKALKTCIEYIIKECGKPEPDIKEIQWIAESVMWLLNG